MSDVEQQIADAERKRIVEELRGLIPPPWGGLSDISDHRAFYWNGWWDAVYAVEANFDLDRFVTREERQK